MHTTRKAAQLAGDRIYDTGKPCPANHTAGRYASNGSCVGCTQEANFSSRGLTVTGRAEKKRLLDQLVVSKLRLRLVDADEFTDCVVAVTLARHPWASRADVLGKGVRTSVMGGRALLHYHIDPADHVMLFKLAEAFVSRGDDATMASIRAVRAEVIAGVEQEANARDNGETPWKFT